MRYLTGRGVFSSPAIAADGPVYVGSHDSYVYAFAAPSSDTSTTADASSTDHNSTPSSLAALAVLVVIPLAVLLCLCWCCTYRKASEGGGSNNTRDRGPWVPADAFIVKEVDSDLYI